MPENSNGTEGLKKFREIGYPDLFAVTNSLFNHSDGQDFPSGEVDQEIALTLRESGSYLKEKVIESLLANRSPQSKHALLKEVLPYWTRTQLQGLASVIYGFIEGYDFHGLDVYAIKLMSENNLKGHQDMDRWLSFKKDVYARRLAVLESVGNEKSEKRTGTLSDY